MKYLIILFSVVLSLTAQADQHNVKQHGEHKIFYSAFNSTFIDPDIAVANQIVRGKDKGLVNIAVVLKAGSGEPAIISGNVFNIFQMSQKLEFFEVREQDTIYYLAPFEFENEDFLTFKISVQTDSSMPAYQLKFQKKMYHD
jgi:hypothetical protein